MLKFDCIRILNAVFYAYHGVGTDEQNLGGKFEVHHISSVVLYDVENAFASMNSFRRLIHLVRCRAGKDSARTGCV